MHHDRIRTDLVFQKEEVLVIPMVHLEKVTIHNIWTLMKLEVHENQKEFVASNTQSIAEAYLCLANNGKVFPFGLYDNDTPVGFLMIGYGTDDEWENPPAIARNNYSIWRLMIDRSHQHKGYGRKAVELALQFIRTWPCGKAEYCYLDYEPENTIARDLYHSFGFIENGETDGDEIIAVKKL